MTHLEIQQAANELQSWVQDFMHRDVARSKHLAFIGQVGTGKTRAADKIHFFLSRVAIECWEKKWWAKPPRLLWAEWAQIVFLPQDEWKRWLDGLGDTDLIFIEDVGAEVDRFKNGEPAERFREVLNDFKNRWLFITSNVFPEQWAQKWDERIADRLLRNSRVIVLRETPRFDK